MTTTSRRVRTIVLIAVAGFLLALLIPSSQRVSLFRSTTEHKSGMATVVRGQSDILVPLRGLVQMSVVMAGAIAASIAALLGSRGRPD